MFVIKRNGKSEKVYFDKITTRISRLIAPIELSGEEFKSYNFANETDYLDPTIIAQQVVSDIYNGITTKELDLAS